MNSLVIILVLISAVMHAGWNLICKSKAPSAAFFLWVRIISLVLMIPLFIYYTPRFEEVPALVWCLLVISGFFGTLGDIGLTNAYRLSDITLTYPMTRSLPVLLVPLVCFVVGYGKPLSLTAVLGMVVIAIGCLLIPWRSAGASVLETYLQPALLFVMLKVIGTTANTINDSIGMGLLKSTFSPIDAALFYISFEYLFCFIFLLPYVFYSRREKHNFRMIRQHSLRYPLMAGVIIPSCYTLILLAMRYASNVSFVVALSQASILIGVLFGVLVLKEKVTRFKVIGVAFIFTGLLLAILG